MSGQPTEDVEEDAAWEAFGAWAHFEPHPGQPKAHSETLFFPEECTHYFEVHQHTLFDLTGTSVYQEASDYRKRLIDHFSEGFEKFVSPPFLRPRMDAPPRMQGPA
jgi:hypothetical protein